jgi:predicted adenine nucleotide alpha hydrolase (AANH) superfamily ATPase
VRILLHVCCGPCALGPQETLKVERVQLTGYWYNPNIHPYSEYQRRLMTAGFLFGKLQIPLIEEEAGFFDFLSGLVAAQRDKKRCLFCWQRRLEKTALAAKARGLDGFTTTLLASSHQDHQALKELGLEIGRKTGTVFFYRDFRVDGKEALAKSRGLGLYHQNYCGCLYSEWERFVKQPHKTGGI